MAEEKELRKTVVIDASPEVVFKALTDEKELIQWMPKEAKMDARVDGEYKFKYHWAAREIDTILRGKILELVPNERLSYTWDAQTMSGSQRITSAVVTWILDLLPDGKTKVTLIHTNVSKEFRQDAESGWNFYLGQLQNFFTKKPT
jgi:uncharacterized protein YndB with AHSA1/START domain